MTLPTLEARLRTDLTAAMRARDTVAVRALRSALAAIGNAGAVPVAAGPPSLGDGPIAGAARGLGAGEAAGRDLGEADIVALVETEIAEREQAAGGYDELGRADAAATLRTEAAALRRALDRPLDGSGPAS